MILNKIKETNVNGNTRVALFIRDDNNTILSGKLKETILKEYCNKNNYEVETIINYVGEPLGDGNVTIGALELIQNSLSKYEKLIIYDMKEIADYKSNLFAILKILTDYELIIESVCDGTYGKEVHFDITMFSNSVESKLSDCLERNIVNE